MRKSSKKESKSQNLEWLTNRKRVGLAGNKKTSTNEVPTLTYGADNNFPAFKVAVATAALEIFGNAARFFESDERYEPDEIDPDEYDLDNDAHKLNLDDLREARKTRATIIAKIKEDEPAVYAYLWRHLSNESRDAIKLLEGYETIHEEKDPVTLWLAIGATHRIATSSTVPTVQKAESRTKYQNMQQGSFESIVSYKERFDD